MDSLLRIERLIYDVISSDTQFLAIVGGNIRLYRVVAPDEPTFPYMVYDIRTNPHGPEDALITGAYAISMYTYIQNNRYGQVDAMRRRFQELFDNKFLQSNYEPEGDIYMQFYPMETAFVETGSFQVQRTDLTYLFKINTHYQPV